MTLYLGGAMESQDAKTEAKTSAHTPGPWSVGRGAASGVVHAGALTVATAHADHEANACLISAAPDLLAACEAQLESFRKTCEAIADDSPWLLTRIREHANAAESLSRTAIAKARGK